MPGNLHQNQNRKMQTSNQGHYCPPHPLPDLLEFCFNSSETGLLWRLLCKSRTSCSNPARSYKIMTMKILSTWSNYRDHIFIYLGWRTQGHKEKCFQTEIRMSTFNCIATGVYSPIHCHRYSEKSLQVEEKSLQVINNLYNSDVYNYIIITYNITTLFC